MRLPSIWHFKNFKKWKPLLPGGGAWGLGSTFSAHAAALCRFFVVVVVFFLLRFTIYYQRIVAYISCLFSSRDGRSAALAGGRRASLSYHEETIYLSPPPFVRIVEKLITVRYVGRRRETTRNLKNGKSLLKPVVVFKPFWSNELLLLPHLLCRCHTYVYQWSDEPILMKFLLRKGPPKPSFEWIDFSPTNLCQSLRSLWWNANVRIGPSCGRAKKICEKGRFEFNSWKKGKLSGRWCMYVFLSPFRSLNFC